MGRLLLHTSLAASSILLVLLASCAPSPLEYEFAGCVDVVVAEDLGVCVLEEGRRDLRVWAASEEGTSLEVARGARLQAEPEAIQGGWLFRLEVEPGAKEVVLRGLGEGVSEGATVPVRWRRSMPYLDTLGERLAGPDPETVRREAQTHLRELLTSVAAGLDRGRILAALAELEEDPRRAAETSAKAAEIFAEEGRIYAQIDALTYGHYVLFAKLGDDAGAREALEDLPVPVREDGASAILAAIHRSSWDINFGRLRRAYRTLADAQRRVQRLGDPGRIYLRQNQGVLASRLGLYEEAREIQAWLRPRAAELPTACHQADLYSDLGWMSLLMLAGDAPADPVVDLEPALEKVAGCSSGRLAVVATNLALAYLREDRVEEAQEVFSRAMAQVSEPPSWVLQWRYVVEGRIALARGQGEAALASFRHLEELGRRLRPAMSWRAAIGRARAFEILGRPEEAHRAYSLAEDLVDGPELQAPFPESGQPESAYVFFQRGTRLFLELLYREGRYQEALDLARQSRRRALRRLSTAARLEGLTGKRADRFKNLQKRYGSLRREIEDLEGSSAGASGESLAKLSVRREEWLEAQGAVLEETWELLDPGGASQEGLPAWDLSPGELALVFHPLVEGWLGLAVSRDGVEGKRLIHDPAEDPSLRALSAALLSPFGSTIRKARRLRILPFGSLWRTDFQALPFGSGVLLDQAPVVYSLDLAPLPPAAPCSPCAALLVGDPTRSLLYAEEEIRFVTGALEAQGGWKIERAEPASEDSAWLRRSLETGLELFHFAGHGPGQGGRGFGLDQGLHLGGGTYLSPVDILTRRQVPPRTVLSACSVLEETVGSVPVALGVGQAFLLAGGREVIGPVGPVDDETAKALVEILYQSWPDEDGARALGRAQRSLREAGKLGDGIRFRVLTR